MGGRFGKYGDAKRKAELMIDHKGGASPVVSYEIRLIDTDYFTQD
jgi:restriction endonuclease Mrr